MMRITRHNLELLQTLRGDLSQAAEDITEPVEMWLDEDAEREDRADAREQIVNDLPDLSTACADVLALLGET